MAVAIGNTDFSTQTAEVKTLWSKDLWKIARNNSFIHQFKGKSHNAMVQHISELTKSEKGARAVVSLVADLEGDGVVGDTRLEDSEEKINTYEQVIRIDQLRNANRLAGRMADQKSVINFRKSSRNVLGYWLADRLDQMAFLTLSGIPYTSFNNGATRPVNAVGKNLSDLDFAADVSSPSTNRFLRWDSVTKDLATGATASVIAADTLTYAALVRLKAYAKDNYIRGIKTSAGEEVFHVFVSPQAMAALKLDPDYLNNVRSAGIRGGKNPLFAGTSSVMVDGLVIHEYRHVFNTAKAAGGSKWGATGVVDGQRTLFCGAQSLAMADIGNAEWVEKTYDYDNQHGISVSKVIGFLKPKFQSTYTGTVEDFGVIAMDTAI